MKCWGPGGRNSGVGPAVSWRFWLVRVAWVRVEKQHPCTSQYVRRRRHRREGGVLYNIKSGMLTLLIFALQVLFLDKMYNVWCWEFLDGCA